MGIVDEGFLESPLGLELSIGQDRSGGQETTGFVAIRRVDSKVVSTQIINNSFTSGFQNSFFQALKSIDFIIFN